MNTTVAEQENRNTYREALLRGFDLGNRYAIVSNYQGNRGLNGTMFRKTAGSSMEFLEHRDYQPGDDLRHIDWKVMAKRDQAYLKCFEQESTPILDIVLDHSQSMRLSDGANESNSSKAAGVLKLLAAVVAAANNSHYHVKIWTAGTAVGQSSSEMIGGCHLFPLPAIHAGSWPVPEFSSVQNLAESFLERPPQFRSNGFRILISDLLFDADPFPIVQQLVQGAQRSVILQVLGQSDVTPPDHGSIRVVDSETGETQTVYIDSQLQAKYREALENHQARWNESATRNGCFFIPLVCERILNEDSLRELEESQILCGSNRPTV